MNRRKPTGVIFVLAFAFLFGASSVWSGAAYSCSPPPEFVVESIKGDHPECFSIESDYGNYLSESLRLENFCQTQIRLDVLECRKKSDDTALTSACDAETTVIDAGGEKVLRGQDLDIDSRMIRDEDTLLLRYGWSTPTDEGVIDVEFYHQDNSTTCDPTPACSSNRRIGSDALLPYLLLPLLLFAWRKRQ